MFKPRSILLVDDSAFFAMKLASYLSSAFNVEMVVVHTQEAGLEHFYAKSFDLVIWDIMMLKVASLQVLQSELKHNHLVLLRSTETEALRWKNYAPDSHAQTHLVKKPSNLDAMKTFCEEMKRLPMDKPIRRRVLKPHPNPTLFPSYMEDSLRMLSKGAPFGIGIVASTGGPMVLVEMLKVLPADFPIPIFVVQHMSGGFMQTFTDWLDARVSLPVRLAADGRAIEPGIWLAPDGVHLCVYRENMALDGQLEHVQFAKPSGTVLLQSLANAFGHRALGIVMTGLGQDGAIGLAEIQRQNGRIYVQHPDTCTIPGMVNSCLRLCEVDGLNTPEELGQILQGLMST